MPEASLRVFARLLTYLPPMQMQSADVHGTLTNGRTDERRIDGGTAKMQFCLV